MDLLLPAPEPAVTDDRILELYGRPPGTWLRVDFVSSLDGAATRDGLSGGLQPPGDDRVFGLLRWLADVVLVASGTVKAEGYGALRVDDAAVTWRRAAGLADHPVFAVVSGSLDLDPASPVFADAPVRPIVLTTASSPADRRAALADVAEVVVAGDTELDVAAARAALADQGLPQILCEGGPSLFGTLIASDGVDELCLSLSPQLVAGDAPRIAHGSTAAPRALTLHHVLREGGGLFLSYRRAS